MTALTLITGFAVAWTGLSSHFLAALQQGFLTVLALSLGSLTGHLLGLQRGLSGLVKWAGAGGGRSVEAQRGGFPLEAVVLAVNPLGLAGAVLEGWTGDWRPLALKGALDALAAVGFAVAGSRTVLLAALPVLAVQGTLTFAAALLAQQFPEPAPAAALRLCTGVLVIAAAPVVLGLHRVPLANYLPALIYAPLLAARWH